MSDLPLSVSQAATGPPKLAREERERQRILDFIEAHRGQWVMLRTVEGCELKMLCGDGVTDRLLQRDGFEPNLCALLKALLRHPATVVDLGAHVGLYSCLFGVWQSGCRIVAVEPNPVLVPVLAENLARNGIAATVLSAAIGREPGRARLTFPENRPALGTLGRIEPTPRCTALRETEVDIITWDRVFAACGRERVRVLKMDLEGYDVKAIAALSEAQADRIDHIICEFSEQRLAQCGSCRADLAGLPWLDQFEMWVVDQVAVPVRLSALSDFPTGPEILWLRRRDLPR